MAHATQPQSLPNALWRQKLLNFGLTVMATVVGGLVVAGILWGVGALNQVSSLTAKVDLIEENMNHGFDDLKSSVAELSNDPTLKNIENKVNELGYEIDKIVISDRHWQQDVEFRLTVLEEPVGGAPDDDTVNSLDPSRYLPKFPRGSRR